MFLFALVYLSLFVLCASGYIDERARGPRPSSDAGDGEEILSISYTEFSEAQR